MYKDDNEEPLKVGMTLQYPPFETIDINGDAIGVSVEMAYELGMFLEREVEIVDLPWGSLIPAVNTGEIDLILGSMSITAEREESVDFSNPYFYFRMITLLNKDFAEENGMCLLQKEVDELEVIKTKMFEKEIVAPRARGVIALDTDACTSCMLCARQCPDWCIYIEGHKELQPPAKPGGRERSRAVLDRFDIDYALCMYCGICVEVCPFDALFWSPEYEYSEPNISDLLHDKTKLSEWMETVPEAPELEAGADKKKK